MAIFDPFGTAAALADCICATLKSPDRGDDVWEGNCCVWPGSRVSYDNCCEGGGQASVVAVNGYPTKAFPTQATGAEICGQVLLSWATVYEITVTRCVPTQPGCDCDCKEQAASRIMGDLQAVLQGINCCFAESLDDDCDQFVVNGWKLIPPQGGCSGVIATVTVSSDAICCPPPN